MAVRRISDLPTLKEDEITNKNFKKSILEISYPKDTDSEYKYESRMLTIGNFVNSLLDVVLNDNISISGNKIFLDGINVSNFIDLSGDLSINNTSDKNKYSGYIGFNSLSIDTNETYLSGNGYVNKVDLNNGKSIVNKEYLDQITNLIYDNLQEYLNEEIEKIRKSLITVDKMWPVGSLYMTSADTCPISSLIEGSEWKKIEGKYILASGTLVDNETYNANDEVSAGAPSAVINVCFPSAIDSTGFSYPMRRATSEAFKYQSLTGKLNDGVYGLSKTIRPPAYVVNVWLRIK